MSGLTRRQLLRSLVGCATTAGTVVLARTVLAEAPATAPVATAAPDERADKLAEELPVEGECGTQQVFSNGAFRNGSFSNSLFRNSPFSNSLFHNGLFNNGAFRNSPFSNGLFRNGAPYTGSPTNPPIPTTPPKTTPPPKS